MGRAVLKGTSMARLSLLLALPALVAGTCEVDLDSVSGSYPPLLIQQGDFKLPTKSRVLKFEDDEDLELYCHGSDKHQVDTYLEREKDSVHESSVIVSCSHGKFQVKGTKEKINVEEASCNRKQEPRLSLVKEQCSPVGADGRRRKDTLVRVSLGWQLGDSYIEQIHACVDTKFAGTLWTNHTVHGASIDFQDKDPVRPAFRVDTSGTNRFFPWTTSTGLNSLYSKRKENSTVESELDGVKTILEGEAIIETSSSGTNYFAKGHLAPDAAFIYNVQQDATYYFVNVAPQFQSFNNGNWKALEMAVRKLASSLGRDLHVVTGTYDILQYPNSKKKMTDIFLEEEQSLVPAPKYYWKLVRDPINDTAAVFIGLNNPHIKKAPRKLCKDRCSEMSSWVKWSTDRLEAGYMYCCSVEDASKRIKAIPKLTETGGLLVGQEETETGDSEGEEKECRKNKKGVYTCPCTCNR